MSASRIVAVLTICCFWQVHGRTLAEVQNLLYEGHKGNPGMIFAVSHRALDYAADLAKNVMKNRLTGLPLPDVEADRGSQGMIYYKNVYIEQHDGPSDVSIKGSWPDYIELAVRRLDIVTHGELSGWFRMVYPRDLSGELQVSMPDIHVVTRTKLDWNERRAIQMMVKSCHTSIGIMSMAVTNGGRMGNFINTFRGIIAAVAKPGVERGICNTMTKMVNEDLNLLLGTMNLTRPVQPFRSHINIAEKFGFGDTRRQKREDNKMGLLGEMLLTGDMVVNYALTEQPTASTSGIVTKMKGDVSWHNEGNTPFYPPDIDWSMPRVPSSTDPMATIVVTDHLFNSLFYHAFMKDMLTVVIDPHHPTLGGRMKTTCDGMAFELCAGDVIPSLSEQFADHFVRVDLIPKRAPMMNINEMEKDVVLILMSGVVEVLVDKNKNFTNPERVMRGTVEAEAMMVARFQENIFSGKVRFTKFNMQIINAPKLPQIRSTDDLFEFKETVRDLLADAANIFFESGVKLPTIDGITLQNANFSLGRRYISVSLDMLIDTVMLENIAANLITTVRG